MTLLSFLATLFGTFQALANLPQAYQIYRRKSAGDVSVTTNVIFLAGSVIWVLYGFEIGDFPVIFANSLGIVTLTLVLFGCVRYREKEPGRQPGRR